jgi:DNA modification methylase
VNIVLNANSLHIPLASESVQCVITSPPYWGLRDYGLPPTIWGGESDCIHEWVEGVKHGHDGGKNSPKTKIKGQVNFQITPDSHHAFCSSCGAWHGCLGLEPTPELFVSHIVSIFREVWRVLKPNGTLWINFGDCYATTPNGTSAARTKEIGNDDRTFRDKPFSTITRSKRLPRGVGRWGGGNNPAGGDIKPKDIVGIPWMVSFALRADGWWLRSDIIWHKPNPMPDSVTDRPTKAHEYVFLLSKSASYYYDAEAIAEPIAQSTANDERLYDENYDVGRPERGYTGSAQRGSGLLKPKMNGGNFSKKYAGVQPNHGGESERTSYLTRNKRTVWTIATQSYSGAHFATFPTKLVEPMILAGSKPGDLVLDPFAGTATVGRMAIKHSRNFIGLELKPEYIKLAHARMSHVQISL